MGSSNVWRGRAKMAMNAETSSPGCERRPSGVGVQRFGVEGRPLQRCVNGGSCPGRALIGVHCHEGLIRCGDGQQFSVTKQRNADPVGSTHRDAYEFGDKAEHSIDPVGSGRDGGQPPEILGRGLGVGRTGRTVRRTDLLGAEVANACESLIEAVYLGRPDRCEEAVDEVRRCPKGQLDAGLGKAPLRVRQSQEPGGSDEFEFREVEDHGLPEVPKVPKVDDSLQGRPEVQGGKILEPPMKSEQSTPTFETGRQFEPRRFPDDRHDARLGNFTGEGGQRRLSQPPDLSQQTSGGALGGAETSYLRGIERPLAPGGVTDGAGRPR